MMVVFVLTQMKQLILRERSHGQASGSESTYILHSAATWRLEPESQDASQTATRGAKLTQRKSKQSLKHRKLELKDEIKHRRFCVFEACSGLSKMV